MTFQLPDPNSALSSLVPSTINSQTQLTTVQNSIDTHATQLQNQIKQLTQNATTALPGQLGFTAPTTPSVPQIQTPQVAGVGGIDQFLPKAQDLLSAELPFFLSGIVGGLAQLKSKANQLASGVVDITKKFAEVSAKIEPARQAAHQLATQRFQQHQAAVITQQTQVTTAAAGIRTP
jgi:X-X-X-Leu-X-X-Gly heptad repeat protein